MYLFYKDIISAYEKAASEEELSFDYHDYVKVREYLSKYVTKQEKAKIIKQYYEFADKLIRDQHDLILEPFFHSMGTEESFYNEIVLNKIKIKKLYVYEDYIETKLQGEPRQTHGEFLEKKNIKYETFDLKDTGGTIKKLFNRIEKQLKKIIK